MCVCVHIYLYTLIYIKCCVFMCNLFIFQKERIFGRSGRKLNTIAYLNMSQLYRIWFVIVVTVRSNRHCFFSDGFLHVNWCSRVIDYRFNNGASLKIYSTG